MTTTIERYHEAASRLDALIDLTPTPTDTSRQAVRARAEIRMGRLVRFLDRLGNPQEGRPLIHIGGTSGKGSTSTTLAAILTAAGYRTGLHTSPYLQTPLEKLQIDGRLIDPDVFVGVAAEFLDEHDRWIADGEEPLTYGEAWNALTWLFFRAEKVDVGVVEVGAGGRFDLTNILTPVLSVITTVGIDHTNTLGPTIEDIAWHKAGIIKPGLPALTTVPNPVAREIIIEEARLQKAPLTVVDLDEAITGVVTGPQGTSWRERASGEEHRMGMAGSFQARNGQAALSAARLLDDLGFSIPPEAIAAGMASARIPGRAELIPGDRRVLLDGAHNPEKLAAFARDVPALLPVAEGGRRIGVVGLLDAKKGDEMLQSIVPALDLLIATSPQVLAKASKQAGSVAELAREAGFVGEVIVERDPTNAITRALAEADSARDDAVLVTGSLYLVGNIRERWYPERDIVAQRTSWPE
ncbi:MAG TPA: Mur ligase family protein [Thermomicrobiales bacterium]|nr:Mur ligase family protein [Thermomicrobiales bacterium]